MVANTIAQNKVNSARSAAMADQARRQAVLDQQVNAENASALGHYTNIAPSIAQEGAGLGALYTAHDIGNPGATAPTGVMPAATGIVQQEDAKQAGKAAAFGEQQGAALAAMNSVGNALQTAGIGRSHDLQQVGLLDNFKKGEAGTLPYALDAANQQGAGARTLGDLLGGAGRIAMGYGLQNAFAPVATAPSIGAALPTLAMGTASPVTAPTLGGIMPGVPAFMSSGNAFNLFR